MEDLQALLDQLAQKEQNPQQQLEDAINNVVQPYSKAPEASQAPLMSDMGIGRATLGSSAQAAVGDKAKQLFNSMGMGDAMPPPAPESVLANSPAIPPMRKPAGLPEMPKDLGEPSMPSEGPQFKAEDLAPNAASKKEDEYAKLLNQLQGAQKDQAWNDIGANMTGIGNEFLINAIPGYKLANPNEVEQERALGKRGLEAIQQRMDSTKKLTDERSNRAQADLAEQQMDPSSPMSMQARSLAKSLLGSDVPENMSAAQLDKLLPGIQQKAALEARKEEAQMRSEDRKMALEDRRLARQDSLADRELKKQELALKTDEAKAEKLNKFQTPYGIANTEDDAKKLKEAHESKKNFDSKLQEMIALREKHGGGAALNREDVQRGEQLSKDLLLEYKNMAKLGVLSAADEKIINAIIPKDPLAFNSPIAALQGQDPILHRLKSFQADSDKDFATRVGTRTRAGIAESLKNGPRRAPSAGMSSDVVRVMSPKGEIKRVPKSQLDAALKAGGKLVE